MLALIVAACNGDSTTQTTVPPDPDQVLLTVTSEGGFVPIEFNLERMPRYVLMADGTLYHQGPVPAIFPGPLLPNVQVSTITEASFGEITALIEELGLPGIDERYDNTGAEMVADASTEVFTYHDETGEHRLAIYALGISEGGGSTDRILANELLQALDTATAEGDSDPYQPERLQVAVGPALQFEQGMSTTEPWPLAVSFEEMDEWAIGWRCMEVAGQEVDELISVLSEANQATLWDTGTEELSMKARPLLPGETACTGAPQAG